MMSIENKKPSLSLFDEPLNQGIAPPQQLQQIGDGGMDVVNARIKHRLFPREFTQSDEFAVYLAIDENKQEIRINYVGSYRPERDERVTAHGSWTQYKGKTSFKAAVMFSELPKGAEGADTWLKFAKIEGVGKVTRDKLIKGLAAQMPEVLADAATMSQYIKKDLAARIAERYESQIGQPKLAIFLAGFGLKEAMIQKIITRFGAASQRIVMEQPWRISECVDGISFMTADKIAQKSGHAPDNPERIVAGLKYSLSQKTAVDGHCGLTKDIWVEEARKLLKIDQPLIEEQIEVVTKDRDAVWDEATDLYYPISLYRSERLVAEKLSLLMEKGDRNKEEEARQAIEEAIRELGVARDESQVSAAIMAVTNPVCIITGGPGTGKSTTQKIIVYALKRLNKKIVLTAPTGKAAKRLSEVTKHEASTCHRVLSWSQEKGGFLYDHSNRLKENRFIIDEFSMVDIKIAAFFVDALRDEAGITFVGDVDQLPSVGPGQVLRDMINSGSIPTVVLKTVHRQSGDSGIVVAAKRINEQEYPLKENETLDGFYMKTNFEDRYGEDAMVQNVIDFMTRRLKGAGYDPLNDIQVLAAQKKGDVGVHKLNEEIKKAINPGTPENTMICKSDGREVAYSVGDRVMQTKNNYERKVFNGEVGFVVEKSKITDKKTGLEEDCLVVEYEGNRVTYSKNETDEITMAWASTVHKSQGCEFPVVIFVCPNSHKIMLTKNLFYTAVTRSKKVCIVLGNKRAVEHAISTVDVNIRGTGLAKRFTKIAA